MSMTETDILLRAIEYNGGGIKSVQRGVYKAPKTDKGKTATITISPVDPNKAFVVSTFWTFLSGEVYGDRGFVSCTLTENSIVLKLEYSRDSGDEFYVDWQVIEYK